MTLLLMASSVTVYTAELAASVGRSRRAARRARLVPAPVRVPRTAELGRRRRVGVLLTITLACDRRPADLAWTQFFALRVRSSHVASGAAALALQSVLVSFYLSLRRSAASASRAIGGRAAPARVGVQLIAGTRRRAAATARACRARRPPAWIGAISTWHLRWRSSGWRRVLRCAPATGPRPAGRIAFMATPGSRQPDLPRRDRVRPSPCRPSTRASAEARHPVRRSCSTSHRLRRHATHIVRRSSRRARVGAFGCGALSHDRGDRRRRREIGPRSSTSPTAG